MVQLYRRTFTITNSPRSAFSGLNDFGMAIARSKDRTVELCCFQSAHLPDRTRRNRQLSRNCSVCPLSLSVQLLCRCS